MSKAGSAVAAIVVSSAIAALFSGLVYLGQYGGHVCQEAGGHLVSAGRGGVCVDNQGRVLEPQRGEQK